MVEHDWCYWRKLSAKPRYCYCSKPRRSKTQFATLPCCIVFMGSVSLGLHRWPVIACQRVLCPQRSLQLQPKFYFLSLERCGRGGTGFRACRGNLKNIVRGCAGNGNAFVVADDKKNGNKQIISITSRLYDYFLDNDREPEVLHQLREETASMRGRMMQVSPDQAQLLATLVQIHGAEKCIEVGVSTVTLIYEAHGFTISVHIRVSIELK